MKKIILISVALTTAIWYGCRNSENKNHEHSESAEHSHEEGEKNHSHEHNSEHSQQMNETREWLKQELGEKYNQPVSPVTEAQLEQGRKIYIAYCANCHGKSGIGDGEAAEKLNPKPADFTDPEHSSFYSEQGRIYIIKKGSKGTAMTAWENTLSEEKILAVYGYVKSLKNSESTHENHEHTH